MRVVLLLTYFVELALRYNAPEVDARKGIKKPIKTRSKKIIKGKIGCIQVATNENLGVSTVEIDRK